MPKAWTKVGPPMSRAAAAANGIILLYRRKSVRTHEVLGAGRATGSLLKWRETAELFARPGSPHLALIGCCLISLHFPCDIQPGRPVTYVPDVVLKGCVERARIRVWTRARNHATFQNDMRDISYSLCQQGLSTEVKFFLGKVNILAFVMLRCSWRGLSESNIHPCKMDWS